MRRIFFDIIGPILIGLSISYHVSAVWIGNGSLYILSYNPNFCVSYIIKGLQLECGKPHSVTAPFELFIKFCFHSIRRHFL